MAVTNQRLADRPGYFPADRTNAHPTAAPR
jgi:hypothetical protein